MPNHQSADQPPRQTRHVATPGPFTLPTSLAEFNERLRAYKVALPLSQAEYSQLRSAVARPRLVNALRALHQGGTNRSNGLTFMTREIEIARAHVASGAPADLPPAALFQPPKTLADFNDCLALVDGTLSVTPEVHADLVEHVGRSVLLERLRCTIEGDPGAEEATQLLRASIAESNVRLARRRQDANQSSPRSAPADDLPSADERDDGFTGTHAPAGQQEPGRFVGHQNAPSRDRPSATPPSTRDRGRSSESTHHPVANGAPAKDKPKARAYALKAALCLEPTRSTHDTATVCVEMAPAIAGSERSYDWSKKVRFHLMPKELLQFLAVAYRFAPGVRFANHGPTKKKWLMIENQPGKMYVSMGDADTDIMGVPVTEPDVIAGMTSLVLNATREAFFGLCGTELLTLLKQVVAPDIKPLQKQGGRRE